MRLRCNSACCTAACAGLLVLALSACTGNEPLPSQLEQPVSRQSLPLKITGLVYSAQNERGVVHALQADQLLIKPRKFSLFNIRNVNEAVLNNARFETRFYADTTSEQRLFDYEAVLPVGDDEGDSRHRSRSGYGLVTRLVANRVKFDIFRSEQKSMTLTAALGLLENKKRKAEFLNATLRDMRSARRISSRKIIWDAENRVFVVPGAYILHLAAKNVAGESIKVDMDFTIKPL
ncbi:MAG: hypothetical protein BMS9Abin08_0775 [Gammaproteobacteria bacterium]|nr:MAG: hypothetical protein BMS9Abin08_0775 [Gammaproteobacteria bacterium]